MIMVPLYGVSSLISLFSLEAAFVIDAIRDIYEVGPHVFLKNASGNQGRALTPPNPDSETRKLIISHSRLL